MNLISKAYAQEITNPALSSLYSGGPGEGFATLITSLWRTIVIIGGLALLIYLAWGGIGWITSGGDKGKIESSRDRIMHAVLGMGILAASVAIILFLQAVFQLDILNPVFTGPGE
jgi:hypothetical protein